MGYYNTVSISMFLDDFKELVKKSSDNNDESGAISLIKESDIHVNDDTGVVTIMWNMIHWNEEYSDVSFILRFLRSNDICSQIRRVGGQLGDVEDYFYGRAGCFVLETTGIIEELYVNADAGLNVDTENFITQVLNTEYQSETAELKDDSVAQSFQSDISEEEFISVITA